MIEVLVRPATSEGRLFPSYDGDSGILSATSSVDRPWMKGADIDGSVLFDVDEHRVLTNIDVLIPKAKWKSTRAAVRPLGSINGDLIFSEQTLATKSFSLPITVDASADKSQVVVRFGRMPYTETVALSDDCIGLLHGNTLSGFWLSIGE